MEYLIYFILYNKIYVITGSVLLVLMLLSTGDRFLPKTRNMFYIAAVIWVICAAYRANTGRDIIYLLNTPNEPELNSVDVADGNDDELSTRSEGESDNETQPFTVKGPFNKYYSNDAGRKTPVKEL